ncbi:hypothetical protein P7C70_g5812, partial [Phenoliferia sp. Uapishka_3]
MKVLASPVQNYDLASIKLDTISKAVARRPQLQSYDTGHTLKIGSGLGIGPRDEELFSIDLLNEQLRRDSTTSSIESSIDPNYSGRTSPTASTDDGAFSERESITSPSSTPVSVHLASSAHPPSLPLPVPPLSHFRARLPSPSHAQFMTTLNDWAPTVSAPATTQTTLAHLPAPPATGDWNSPTSFPNTAVKSSDLEHSLVRLLSPKVFHAFLSEDAGRESFRNYLSTTERGSSILDLWWDLHLLRRLTEQARSAALGVMDVYLVPDAPKKVRLTSQELTDTAVALRTTIGPGTLEGPGNKLLSSLYSNEFQTYIKHRLVDHAQVKLGHLQLSSDMKAGLGEAFCLTNPRLRDAPISLTSSLDFLLTDDAGPTSSSRIKSASTSFTPEVRAYASHKASLLTSTRPATVTPSSVPRDAFISPPQSIQLSFEKGKAKPPKLVKPKSGFGGFWGKKSTPKVKQSSQFLEGVEKNFAVTAPLQEKVVEFTTTYERVLLFRRTGTPFLRSSSSKPTLTPL